MEEKKSSETKEEQKEIIRDQPHCCECQKRKLMIVFIEHDGVNAILYLVCENCGTYQHIVLNDVMVIPISEPQIKRDVSYVH